MSIDRKINHYSLNNPASIYNEEALTALELAGRTAGLVNECVDNFNELENNTVNHLSEQDNEITTRLKAQDDRIKTMNDITLPNKVDEEMQERIDNGAFDRSIDAHLGNLEARVNNLLGNTVEGSSTLDAEVIDARAGIDPVIFRSVGDAVRNKVEIYVNELNLEALTIGSYVDYAGNTVIKDTIYMSDFIPVKYGRWYINPTYSATVSFYDDNKNFLDGITSVNGVIDIPVNPAYKYFRTIGEVKNITLFTDMVVYGFYPTEYREYGKPFIHKKYIESYLPFTEDNVRHYVNVFNPDTIEEDVYINIEGERVTKIGLYETDYIEAREGTWKQNPAYDATVTFYDKDKNFLFGSLGQGGVFTVPKDPRIKYLRTYGLSSNLESDMVVYGYYPNEYHEFNKPFINNALLENVVANQYNGKTIAYFGDSRVWYDGNAYTENTKDELAGTICIGYQQTVKKLLVGSKYASYGISGASSIDIANKIRSTDLTGVDIVVVDGGVNDCVFSDISRGTLEPIGSAFNINTTYGAWQSALEHIMKNYPDIKIIMTTPYPFWKAGVKMTDDYVDVKKEVSALYAVPCCDLHTLCQFNPVNYDNFYCDKASTGYHLHLNNKGNAQIGHIVANFISSH